MILSHHYVSVPLFEINKNIFKYTGEALFIVDAYPVANPARALTSHKKPMNTDIWGASWGFACPLPLASLCTSHKASLHLILPASQEHCRRHHFESMRCFSYESDIRNAETLVCKRRSEKATLSSSPIMFLRPSSLSPTPSSPLHLLPTHSSEFCTLAFVVYTSCLRTPLCSENESSGEKT